VRGRGDGLSAVVIWCLLLKEMKQFMYSTNDWLYFMDFESP